VVGVDYELNYIEYIKDIGMIIAYFIYIERMNAYKWLNILIEMVKENSHY